MMVQRRLGERKNQNVEEAPQLKHAPQSSTEIQRVGEIIEELKELFMRGYCHMQAKTELQKFLEGFLQPSQQRLREFGVLGSSRRPRSAGTQTQAQELQALRRQLAESSVELREVRTERDRALAERNEARSECWALRFGMRDGDEHLPQRAVQLEQAALEVVAEGQALVEARLELELLRCAAICSSKRRTVCTLCAHSMAHSVRSSIHPPHAHKNKHTAASPKAQRAAEA
eukprot:SAG11_NODE_275_length_11309_cov_6.090901_6_plen_230_part_00